MRFWSPVIHCLWQKHQMELHRISNLTTVTELLTVRIIVSITFYFCLLENDHSIYTSVDRKRLHANILFPFIYYFIFYFIINFRAGLNQILK